MDLTPATVPALPLLPVVAPLLPPQISPQRRNVVFPALAALLVVVIVGLWVTVGGSHSQRPASPKPVLSTATRPQLPRGMQTMAVTHTPNPDRVGGPNAEPTSFTLSIDSTPPDATVIEGGKPIGSTPMVVTIDRRTVSVGPRRFLVKRDGYAPFTLEQGDSKIAVSASATLSVLGHAGRDRPRRPLSKRAAAVALERSTPPGDAPAVTSSESGVAPAPKHGGGPALEIRTRR
jgi:serine/threonine-protein kinase